MKKFEVLRLRMTQEHQTEGIVLTSIPFKDNDRLVTLLSPDYGLLKLFMKGVNRPKNAYFALKEPLTHIDLVFREKRGDFHLFLEGKLLNSFMPIRSSYPHLMASFELVRMLLKTLLPSQPCPEVFLLLKKYFLQFQNFKDPQVLVSSFYLKLLLFEGLLHIKTACARCQQKSEKLYIQNKDYFCSRCASKRDLFFTLIEMQSVFQLVKTRSFEAYKALEIPQELSIKIKRLYSVLHEIAL